MSDPERILSEFISAWEAGARPEPDTYLDRVPAAEQPGLSAQIRAYLLLAPEPEYDEAAWSALAADPAAARARQIPLGPPEAWPSLLPRLRAAAGLTWEQVAARLDVERPQRAAGYLERMERGAHDPRRVTRTALERLARVLGVPTDALGWTGPGAAPAGRALLRLSPAAGARPDLDALDIIAELATTDAGDWDDSDELFCGGRDLG